MLAKRDLENESSLKQVNLALRKLQSENEQLRNKLSEPVAIVGVGCRYVGGIDSLESFWGLLVKGEDALDSLPEARFRNMFSNGKSTIPNEMTALPIGLLQSIDQFDAGYFSISPREAVAMDPCQRILLEVSIEALENAGIPVGPLKGSETGVFIGMANPSGYGHFFRQPNAYLATGIAASGISGRISYTLGLQGPCVTLDTACSASSVAIHIACQSLRNSECNIAIAGGVNIFTNMGGVFAMYSAGALSKSGRCRTFDVSADGYARSEGCGVLVLKRLSEADEAGDRILGVILGSAIAQDGVSNGFTAPNGLAQQKVVQTALRRSQIAPDEVSYIETHGTGTPLGDPIEVGALAAAYGKGHTMMEPLVLGAVKTNIGHSEGAAGVAGVLKLLAMFEHGQIPGNLHFNSPNPRIAWDALPITVPTKTQMWDNSAKRRVGAVSSFGFTGTITHTVIAEPTLRTDPPIQPSNITPPENLILPISAKNTRALNELAYLYTDYLDKHANDNNVLVNTAFCAGIRRDHHHCRLAVLGNSPIEWSKALRGYLTSQIEKNVFQADGLSKQPRVAFVFSGQGTQWWGMGRELLNCSPVFRDVIERCDQCSQDFNGPSIIDELQREQSFSKLDMTEVTQPVLTAYQIGLYEHWKDWGIEAEAVVGHSLGEIAAAYAANAYTLEQAIKLAVARGKIMQLATGKGQMVSISLPEAAVRLHIEPFKDKISLAAANSPYATVVSGDVGTLDSLLARLTEKGIVYTRLSVDYAFHSAQMSELKHKIEVAVGELQGQTCNKSFISTVTAAEMSGESLNANYWSKQVVKPVLFQQSILELLNYQFNIFVEIGAHSVLNVSMQDTIKANKKQAKVFSSIIKNKENKVKLLETVAQLYCCGYNVDWRKIYRSSYNIVTLPRYPWQHKTYWPESHANGVFKHKSKSLEVSIPQQYEIEWEINNTQATTKSKNSLWILFIEPNEKSSKLKSYLSYGGNECICVIRGDTYRYCGEQAYEINPKYPGDFEKLFSDSTISKFLTDEGLHKTFGIVYMWGMESSEISSQSIELSQQTYLNTLFLVQALKRLNFTHPPRLWFVTQNSQGIMSKVEGVLQSPLWGFGASLVLEVPEFRPSLIDLDNTWSPHFLSIQLLQNDSENRLAIRQNERYVARLIPLRERKGNRSIRFYNNATYVLVGGLGGIGLSIAQWMVTKGVKFIALLGRRNGSENVQKIINKMRQTGATINIYLADVTSGEQLNVAWKKIKSELPAIKGVIHTAGVGDQCAISDLTAERFTNVCDVKIKGTWNLHELCRDKDLDFFVLCSSISSLLGSHGQSHYAAANAFLDSFAYYRQALGLPGLSLNWTSWTDVGMAKPVITQTVNYLASQGIGAIDSVKAVKALEKVLCVSAAQVGIFPLKKSALPKQVLYSKLVLNYGRDKTKSSHFSRLASLSEKERFKEIEIAVMGLGAKVLGLSTEISDVRTAFDEFGIDSLAAVEFRHAIEKEFDINLQGMVLTDRESITNIAEVIAEKIQGEKLVEKNLLS